MSARAEQLPNTRLYLGGGFVVAERHRMAGSGAVGARRVCPRRATLAQEATRLWCGHGKWVTKAVWWLSGVYGRRAGMGWMRGPRPATATVRSDEACRA